MWVVLLCWPLCLSYDPPPTPVLSCLIVDTRFCVMQCSGEANYPLHIRLAELLRVTVLLFSGYMIDDEMKMGMYQIGGKT